MDWLQLAIVCVGCSLGSFFGTRFGIWAARKYYDKKERKHQNKS